jgi:hypothetical protein
MSRLGGGLFQVKKQFDVVTLTDAYNTCKSELVGQKQGDCGLFSLWFATMLLRVISPSGRKVVFPRKLHVSPPKGWDTKSESMRGYAKVTHRSAQGEVLSAAEMEDIISHFGYRSQTSSAPDVDAKKQFVAGALALRRPVLVAYVFGDTGPVFKDTGAWDPSKDNAGSHWSLIIGERSGKYDVIEPNNPSSLKLWDRDRLLRSNGCCDDPDVRFVRYWGKDPRLKGTGEHSLYEVGNTAQPITKRLLKLGINPKTGKPYKKSKEDVQIQPVYDVFPEVESEQPGGTSKLKRKTQRAQKLDHVLIAVY